MKKWIAFLSVLALSFSACAVQSEKVEAAVKEDIVQEEKVEEISSNYLTGKFINESYKEVEKEEYAQILQIVQTYLGKGLGEHPSENRNPLYYITAACRTQEAYNQNDAQIPMAELNILLCNLFCMGEEEALTLIKESGRMKDGTYYLYSEDFAIGGGIYEYIINDVQKQDGSMKIIVDYYDGPYYDEEGNAITEEKAYQSDYLTQIIFDVVLYEDGSFGYRRVTWNQ